MNAEKVVVVGHIDDKKFTWVAELNVDEGVYHFNIEQEIQTSSSTEVVLVPQTPQFVAVVHDSQSWLDSPFPSAVRPPLFETPPAMPTFPTLRRMIASDSEEEEEESDATIPYVPVSPPRVVSPPPYVPPVVEKRKRGRPKGSRNKSGVRRSVPRGDFQETPRVPESIEDEENECSCCTSDNQLTIKCRTGACDSYMCVACLKTLDQRFEGICPWCRLRF